MSNYTAVAKGGPATSTLREQHARRVVDAAQDSHSAVTRRNYLAAWRRFSEWADREGFGAMPALPETVAAYLAERAANGLSPASLRLDRAAIRYHHTDAGHANPADNEGVRRVLRGLTRRAAREGRTPKQAAALTEEGLAAIRETAQLRRTGPGGRTERASKARPPRSGGYRARIGHAGRHASALRGCRAHLGRRGVSERRAPNSVRTTREYSSSMFVPQVQEAEGVQEDLVGAVGDVAAESQVVVADQLSGVPVADGVLLHGCTKRRQQRHNRPLLLRTQLFRADRRVLEVSLGQIKTVSNGNPPEKEQSAVEEHHSRVATF